MASKLSRLLLTVMALATGKRHGMIKRTPKQIRQKRGMEELATPDQRIVKKYMPYIRGKV